MTEMNTEQPSENGAPVRPVGSPTPSRRADLQVVELDGEISLYDAQSNNAVTLNATASAIWRRLDGRTGVAELVAALAEEFGTTPDRIAPDVHATLIRLADLGLLG